MPFTLGKEKHDCAADERKSVNWLVWMRTERFEILEVGARGATCDRNVAFVIIIACCIRPRNCPANKMIILRFDLSQQSCRKVRKCVIAFHRWNVITVASEMTSWKLDAFRPTRNRLRLILLETINHSTGSRPIPQEETKLPSWIFFLTGL